jgi:hypothetical protein
MKPFRPKYCGKYCIILSCVTSRSLFVFFIFPPVYFVLTKFVLYPHFDLDWIGSTSFGGSAHLLCINVCVSVTFGSVLI